MRINLRRRFDVNKYVVLIVLIIVIIGLAIINPQFISLDNILNILRQVSITGLIAVGMMMVIITGGIDLSVGAMVGLCSVIGCNYCHPGQNWIVGIIIGIFIGGLWGFIVGLIVSFLNLPPFIVTLAIKFCIQGIALIYTEGNPISDLSEGFLNLGKGSFLLLPIPFWILIISLTVGFILLNNTTYGRYLYAIGGNEESAKLSGVPVKKTKTIVYMISGMFTGLAAMVLSSRVSAGSPIVGNNYDMDAITIAVVGGGSLSGGRGTIQGLIVGIFLIGVVTNGLNLLNVSSYWQMIVKGIIIMIAIIMDSISGKNK